jgi:hypothetical protein
MYIYVFSLLKYKIYLYLHESVEGHLYYATVKFKMYIYICIMLLKISLPDGQRKINWPGNQGPHCALSGNR